MGTFNFVSAAVIADQQVSTTQTASTQVNWYQGLGTGLSGSLNYIQLTANSSGGGTFYVRIQQCDDAAYSVNCTAFYNGSASTQSLTGAKTQFTFITTSQPVFVLSKYYYLWTDGGTLINLWGSSSNVYSGGILCRALNPTSATTCNGGGPADGAVADAAFSVGSVDVVALQPQVNPITTPTQFQVTATENVSVSFTYLNTTLYDIVGTEIIDQTNNHLLLDTGEQIAQMNTTATYNAILGLTQNHAYRVRGYMRNSATSTFRTYNAYVDFSTVSDQFFNASSTLINITNINDANASSTAQNIFTKFWNIQNIIQAKFPFNYLFEIGNALNILSYGTSTTAWTFSLPLNYGSSTSPFNFLPSTWDVITPTTLAVYYPDSIRLFFRTLAGLLLTVGWGLMMFNRARSLFK